MSTVETRTERPALDRVDVTTLQERVYQSIRLALLKGQFLPGEQVSIRNLANALGTSAMPVREAVRRLVAEKAFEQSSDRLLRVAPYAASEHEEFIRIRMQLEGLAAKKASAVRRPELVEGLAKHNDALGKALGSGDLEATLAANQAFHFEIYRAAGSPQLVDIISSLWLRTGPILAAAKKDRELFAHLFEIGHRVHAKAIDAFDRRDRKAAMRAMTLDLRAAHLSLRRSYKLAQAEGVAPPSPGSLLR